MEENDPDGDVDDVDNVLASLSLFPRVIGRTSRKAKSSTAAAVACSPSTNLTQRRDRSAGNCGDGVLRDRKIGC